MRIAIFHHFVFLVLTHYSDSPLLRRPIFPKMQNRTQSINPWFNQVYPTGCSVGQANLDGPWPRQNVLERKRSFYLSSIILSFSCFSRFTLFSFTPLFWFLCAMCTTFSSIFNFPHTRSVDHNNTIYHSFIMSNFSYCPLTWHFCTDQNF
jgi:hypothetical protein